MTTAHIDFETKSAVDLRKTGVRIYAKDESTDVWCCAYAIDDRPIQLWTPDSGPDHDLLCALNDPSVTITAHNVGFEWNIIEYVCGPKYGWPHIDPARLDDTAARAAIQGLPRSLENAAIAMGLEVEKDMKGHSLMLRMAKPRRIEDDGTIIWWNDPDRLDKLYSYCKQDVEVERALDKLLRPMPESERAVWLLDFEMNHKRGIGIDTNFVDEAYRVTEVATRDANKQMRRVTNGRVDAVTKVTDLRQWVNDEGVEAASVDKQSIEQLLDVPQLPPHVRKALQLRRDAGKSSTAKLTTIKYRVAEDGRAYENLLYYGAGTGRFSGRGIQCVTGDHEVLTPDGWQSIESVAGTTARIMQWIPGKGLDWADAPVRCYGPAGQLAYIDGTMIQGKFTLDHRLPNLTAAGKSLNDWTPEKLLTVKKRDGFVTSAPSVLTGCGFTLDQIRLLVAFQADGTWFKKQPVWHFSKTRKIERLHQLFERLGVPFYQNNYADSVQIKIRTTDVPDWLAKQFGPWVTQMSQTEAKAFIAELAYWDGFKHSRNGAVQLMSPEKEQAEWMATAAALAGQSSTLTHYSTNKSNRGRWALYVRSSKTTTIYRSEIEVVASDAPVYCPTTPGGYWLCRYNNRIYITGNCQNLPRPTLGPDEVDQSIEIITDTSESVRTRTDTLDLTIAPPLAAVSSCLRGAIVAGHGNVLRVADYANIEGRVNAWLAGDEEKVKIFRVKGPVYERMASRITGKPVEAIAKDSTERFLGKTAELGAGYGMGWRKFIATCASQGVEISEDMAQRTIESYRDLNSPIVKLWHNLESCALSAMRVPGKPYATNGVSYCRPNKGQLSNFLICNLPSGRWLYYPYPKLQMTETPWGEQRQQLTYMTTNSVTRKWERQKAYGGLLCENTVQALARDILTDAMLKLEEAGYPVVLTVHDEIISETSVDSGSQDEFEQIMAMPPDWASGCPIAVEGFTTTRYRK